MANDHDGEHAEDEADHDEDAIKRLLNSDTQRETHKARYRRKRGSGAMWAPRLRASKRFTVFQFTPMSTAMSTAMSHERGPWR